MMTSKYAPLPLLLALFVTGASASGCARKASPPLPGDSVSDDGGSITLSPPRLSTSPQEAREARDGQLGPIESRLYPPELIMEHQAELAITPEQKTAILAETNKGQADMLRLQWELQGEKEKLVTLLDPDHVDEAKAQAAAAQVMDRETKVKSSHLGMLMRLKNILTADQQKKLREIRANAAQQAPQFATPPTPPPSSSPSTKPRSPRAPQPHNENPGY